MTRRLAEVCRFTEPTGQEDRGAACRGEDQRVHKVRNKSVDAESTRGVTALRKVHAVSRFMRSQACGKYTRRPPSYFRDRSSRSRGG